MCVRLQAGCGPIVRLIEFVDRAVIIVRKVIVIKKVIVVRVILVHRVIIIDPVRLIERVRPRLRHSSLLGWKERYRYFLHGGLDGWSG